MRIKNRLQLNAAVSVLTALVICLMLGFMLVRINMLNASAQIAGENVVNALERVTLRNDYIRNNSARAKEQWFVKHEQMGRLLKLAAETFRDAEDRKIIAECIINQDSIGKIFSAIVANREMPGTNRGSAAMSQEVEQRLISQLNMRVYDEVIYGRQLLESSREARASALRRAAGAIIGLLAIVMISTLVSSWTMNRAISGRMMRLRNGAAIIGGGDLDHRIDIRGDDEFVELAASFNSMTEKLRGSYDDLKREIEERKLTEQQLSYATQRLQALMEAVPVGISFSDDVTCQSITGNPVALTQFEISSQDNLSASAPDAEAPGRQVRFFMGGREISDAELPLQRAVAKNMVIPTMELEVLMPSGRRWFADASGAPVRDAQGNVIGGIAVTVDITERKRAESALQENEARLRLAQESAHVGIWDWKVETGEVDFTPELNRLYGLAPGTIRTYQDWRERVHPADIGGIEAVRDEAIAKHEPFDLEFRGRHSSGEYRWISTKGGAIYNEAGSAVRVLGVNIDITERKQAEEALRQAMVEQEAILESVPLLISLHGRDGAWLKVNPAVVKLFGLDPVSASREEIANRLQARFPDGTPLTEKNMPSSRALQGELVRNVEYVITDSEGTDHVLMINAVPLQKDGNVYGMVLSQTDITDLKLAEKALRESEERKRMVLEASEIGTFEVDLQTGEGRWNNVEYALLGLEPGDAPGSPERFFQYVHPDDVGLLTSNWENALRSGELDAEFRIVRADGQERWLAGKGRFLYESGGDNRPLQFLGVNFDITARKQAEEALLLKYSELETATKLAEDKRLRLAAMMEALPIGVAITDAWGGSVQSNDAFERIWAGPRPETHSIEDYTKYQAWWADTGKPVEPEEWASALAVITGRGVTGQLLKIQRFDGSEAFVINSASPIRDAEGAIAGCAVAVQDITELKRAEQQISGQLEELRILNEDLKLFNKSFVSREFRMIELKKEINELCAQNGEQPRYPLEFEMSDDVE
ncbi:PAS domain S-box protein [Geobacter pelophilus]|uniref:histidine kinase n=1 Tax=Geoanaerobacter pelophilus TaxID=60036 RepID=A0AAW4L7P5_9BACT|nr:PAS domain S-box protein [Geoanaerobacter pelophilus]MBT0664044.1 PAS domain S-box protein [Geoanaerobacter pelophilus]